MNLLAPRSALTMGGLARSRVGHDRHLKVVWPYLPAVFVVVCVFVAAAAALG